MLQAVLLDEDFVETSIRTPCSNADWHCFNRIGCGSSIGSGVIGMLKLEAVPHFKLVTREGGELHGGTIILLTGGNMPKQEEIAEGVAEIGQLKYLGGLSDGHRLARMFIDIVDGGLVDGDMTTGFEEQGGWRVHMTLVLLLTGGGVSDPLGFRITGRDEVGLCGHLMFKGARRIGFTVGTKDGVDPEETNLVR